MSITEFTYLGVDLFKILRLELTATPNEFFKRFRMLKLRFHPDKFNRPLTDSERARNDDIQGAYDIMKEDFTLGTGSTTDTWANVGFHKRVKWVKYDGLHAEVAFQCHNCPNVTNRWTGSYSNISLRWFCSQLCIQNWENNKGFTPETHGYILPGTTTPTPSQTPMRTCPGCRYDRPFRDGGRGWVRYSLTGPNSEFCCSEYCLDTYLWSNGIDVVKCNFRGCRIIKREGDVGDWMKDPADRTKIYCCEEHMMQEKTSGDAGLGAGGVGDPFQAEKATAITEIENALNDAPPVTNVELEDANQNWRNEIQNATIQGTIDLIKTNVLMDISTKRKAKDGGGGGDQTQQKLAQLCAQAIAAIETELDKDPKVDQNELTNPDWKNELSQATSKSAITDLCDRVIADIRHKRDEEKKVLTLLAQGKTQNTYPELAQTIQELKKYLSTRAYQEHQAEINQLEEELSRLNPDQYKASIRNDLNQAIKNCGLSASEVEAETQQVIEEAIQDPTPSKKRAAEEAIAQNGANVGLQKLLTLARTLKTEKEKKALLISVLTYLKKDAYCEKAHQKFKSEVDKVLAQLQDKKVGNNNTQNFPPLLLKIILPLAAVGFLGLVIGIIWWKSKKRLKRQK